MNDGMPVRQAIAAAEKKREKQYSPQQKKFLVEYAKNDFKDGRKCAEKAGIPVSTYWRIISTLKDDITEIARAMLLGAAPEAALTISGLLSTNDYDPSNAHKLSAAKEILDRVGVVKEEKVNHDHKVSGGLFIIPAKQPLPLEEAVDGEYTEEVHQER